MGARFRLSIVFIACFFMLTGFRSSKNVRGEERIAALLEAMTLEEKISMVSGTGFDTMPIPRLGIPSITMTDGPLGIRNGKNTAFPAGIAMAASFDTDLIRDVARAIADEARVLGKNMVLGPAVNISRQPFGGRNFESFGEDPHLTSALAASYVEGIQGQNVLACVKHLAVNDQEYERMTIDVRVGERALHEIHLPAFKSAIDAGVWSVISAYNKVNGHHASENEYLQTKVVKDLWGFKGFVVSDWGATHSTVEAANSGLDLEMPDGLYFGEKLLAAVRRGEVAEATIDDKVRRLLRAMWGIGLLDPSVVAPAPAPLGPTSREHRDLARKLAEKSAVLLKNEGALPLNESQLRRVALIGPNANAARTGGGGSSMVEPLFTSTPLQGFRDRLGKRVELRHALGYEFPGMAAAPKELLRPDLNSNVQGLRGEYFDNTTLSGAPVLTRIDPTVNFDFLTAEDARFRENFSVRWSGYFQVPRDGTYYMSVYSDDGARLYVDGKEVLNNWSDHPPEVRETPMRLRAGHWYPVRFEYYQGGGAGVATFGWTTADETEFPEAVAAARGAQAAIVFTGLGTYMEGEAWDRAELAMPRGQVALIKAVARANPNTIVVLTSGNPLPMGEWIDDVKAVVQTWYPGQEGGYAIADLLLGRANFSGKLPVTFLKRWEDSPAYGHYPGDGEKVFYNEGIFVGYRHFDARGITPEFPFGHGLSYTSFSYSNLDVARRNGRIVVSLDVQNTGRRAGEEIAQVYVSEARPMVARPPQELKGFAKVELAAGETKRVSIELGEHAFSFYDERSSSWRANPGVFEIRVGASSRDIRLRKAIRF